MPGTSARFGFPPPVLGTSRARAPVVLFGGASLLRALSSARRRRRLVDRGRLLSSMERSLSRVGYLEAVPPAATRTGPLVGNGWVSNERARRHTQPVGVDLLAPVARRYTRGRKPVDVVPRGWNLFSRRGSTVNMVSWHGCGSRPSLWAQSLLQSSRCGAGWLLTLGPLVDPVVTLPMRRPVAKTSP